MTKSVSRRIGANEWLQEYFSPVMGVLASDDAELLCRKNNLTLVELLQPFGRVNEHLTVKDPEGVIHNVPTLSVNFQVNVCWIRDIQVTAEIKNSLDFYFMIITYFDFFLFRISEKTQYGFLHPS